MPEPIRQIDAVDTTVNQPSILRFRFFEATNPAASQAPAAPPSRHKILRQHFFRRFFDNDTVSIEGETQTAVIRALAFCAVPGLMFAFWLLPAYPGNPPRPLSLIEGDRYFFVLFSFVTMGAVATFEWEMLFPDRADFLILLPLPLKSRELFYAKSSALALFLGMFLIATNVFACILFPAVSTRGQASPLLACGAHFAAVFLAGIFAALTMLAVEGLLISLLPPRWFRPISTAIQSLSITVLGLLFLLYPLIARNLSTLLSGNISFAKLLPPLWFMALYEQILDGSSAGVASLAAIGLYATAAAALLCLITYPLGWAHQKKRALEGASTAGERSRSLIAALLHKTLLRRPQQRAIFHFLTQTIARSPRYQVYLALYSGAGLALALCSILGLRRTPDHTLVLSLSQGGLHAVLPLLLFWLVVGLRAAFSFPVDMLARWIFPISMQFAEPADAYPAPYAYPGRAAKAARTFTLLCCAALTAAVLALLLALHWNWTSLLIQALCGAGLSLILADLFFLGRTQIPFTRPRLPGRAGLPLLFVLYAALFPALVLITIQIEFSTEAKLRLLVWIVGAIAGLHLILNRMDKLAQHGIIGGFPEDETDEGPQVLGLTQ